MVDQTEVCPSGSADVFVRDWYGMTEGCALSSQDIQLNVDCDYDLDEGKWIGSYVQARTPVRQNIVLDKKICGH